MNGHTRITDADHFYNADGLSCGELLIQLKLRMRDDWRAGETIELIATSEGVHIDLVAWCGLTGHELLRAQPPRYLLRKRQG